MSLLPPPDHPDDDRLDALAYMIEQSLRIRMRDAFAAGMPPSPNFAPFPRLPTVADAWSRNQRMQAQVDQDLDEVFLSMCGIRP